MPLVAREELWHKCFLLAIWRVEPRYPQILPVEIGGGQTGFIISSDLSLLRDRRRGAGRQPVGCPLLMHHEHSAAPAPVLRFPSVGPLAASAIREDLAPAQVGGRPGAAASMAEDHLAIASDPAVTVFDSATNWAGVTFPRWNPSLHVIAFKGDWVAKGQMPRGAWPFLLPLGRGSPASMAHRASVPLSRNWHMPNSIAWSTMMGHRKNNGQSCGLGKT